MTKAELLKLLQDIDDNAEVTVIDDGQNYCWDITGVTSKTPCFKSLTEAKHYYYPQWY